MTDTPSGVRVDAVSHDQRLMGMAALMKQAFDGSDLAALGNRLIERANADPDDANALLDLATVLQLKGDLDLGLQVQAQALQARQCYRLPAESEQLRLLAIMAPGELMANTPLEFLLEGSDVTLEMLYVAPGLAVPEALPDHDVAFVAVGESDASRPVLDHAARLTASWPEPLLNPPAAIATLARDNVCRLLAGTPGLVMPACVRAGRSTLSALAGGALAPGQLMDDARFPLIVRPVGSHAGRGLARVDSPEDVAAYLERMPDEAFYLSPFVDYRGADGQFRKYRVVFIDGQPFAGHMAISDHWMIHYLNAGMADSADKRAEEAAFMEHFDTDFADRHRGALRAVVERVGLDYFGIDCAQTPSGELLVFEVDSALVVHAMDDVERFPYKRPQLEKVAGAFRELLIRTAERA